MKTEQETPRPPVVVSPYTWRGTRYDTAEFHEGYVVLRRKTRTGQDFVGRKPINSSWRAKL